MWQVFVSKTATAVIDLFYNKTALGHVYLSSLKVMSLLIKKKISCIEKPCKNLLCRRIVEVSMKDLQQG